MKKQEPESEDESELWINLVENVFAAIMELYVYHKAKMCKENCPNKCFVGKPYDPRFLEKALEDIKRLAPQPEPTKKACGCGKPKEPAERAAPAKEPESTFKNEGKNTMPPNKTLPGTSKVNIKTPSEDSNNDTSVPATSSKPQTLGVVKPKVEDFVESDKTSNVLVAKNVPLPLDDDNDESINEPSQVKKIQDSSPYSDRKKDTSKKKIPKETIQSSTPNKSNFDDSEYDETYEDFLANSFKNSTMNARSGPANNEVLKCQGCDRIVPHNKLGICLECKMYLMKKAISSSRPRCCRCGELINNLHERLCKPCLIATGAVSNPNGYSNQDYGNYDNCLYVVPANEEALDDDVLEEVNRDGNTRHKREFNNFNRSSVNSCESFDDEEDVSDNEPCFPCKKKSHHSMNKNYSKNKKCPRNYETRHFTISPFINPNLVEYYNDYTHLFKQDNNKFPKFEEKSGKVADTFDGMDFDKQIFSTQVSKGSLQTTRTYEKEFVYPDHRKVIKTEITTTQPRFAELLPSKQPNDLDNSHDLAGEDNIWRYGRSNNNDIFFPKKF